MVVRTPASTCCVPPVSATVSVSISTDARSLPNFSGRVMLSRVTCAVTTTSRPSSHRERSAAGLPCEIWDSNAPAHSTAASASVAASHVRLRKKYADAPNALAKPPHHHGSGRHAHFPAAIPDPNASATHSSGSRLRNHIRPPRNLPAYLLLSRGSCDAAQPV